jgi:hypothetical protein
MTIKSHNYHFYQQNNFYFEWGLLGCYVVWLVRADVSEEISASFIRVTRIGELGTTIAVTSNRRTLRRNTSVLAVCVGC